MHFCPARSHRVPHKDPVDSFSLLEERVRFRRRMATRKSVFEVRLIERVASGSRGSVKIEITPDYNKRARLVPLYIRENFVQLRAAQPVIPSALEMQVVCHHGPVSDLRFADQREPSPDPLLK